MNISRTLPACALLVLLVSPDSRAQGFVNDNVWPPGSSVVLHLGLGPASIRLQDGSANWNAMGADAVTVWDGYLDFITFSSVSSPSVAHGMTTE